jgi:hypothetical protein
MFRNASVATCSEHSQTLRIPLIDRNRTPSAIAFCVFSVWPSRSGIVPSLDDGGPQVSRSASRISRGAALQSAATSCRNLSRLPLPRSCFSPLSIRAADNTGYPHGMLSVHADVINPDLLAFIKGLCNQHRAVVQPRFSYGCSYG